MWLSHHSKPNEIKQYDFKFKYKTELCKNWKDNNGLCPGKKVNFISNRNNIFKVSLCPRL